MQNQLPPERSGTAAARYTTLAGPRRTTFFLLFFLIEFLGWGEQYANSISGKLKPRGLSQLTYCTPWSNVIFTAPRVPRMGLPPARRGAASIPSPLAQGGGACRWVKGGLGQSPGLGPAWEGGLSGPEGGGRQIWSWIWRAEPTRLIYAPRLGGEPGGTATKGRFS